MRSLPPVQDLQWCATRAACLSLCRQRSRISPDRRATAKVSRVRAKKLLTRKCELSGLFGSNCARRRDFLERRHRHACFHRQCRDRNRKTKRKRAEGERCRNRIDQSGRGDIGAVAAKAVRAGEPCHGRKSLDGNVRANHPQSCGNRGFCGRQYCGSSAPDSPQALMAVNEFELVSRSIPSSRGAANGSAQSGGPTINSAASRDMKARLGPHDSRRRFRASSP